MAKKHSAPGTLRGTVQEMRDGTWLAKAQTRSTRRKSPWNLLLLLIFPLWLVIWFATIKVGLLLHFALRHEPVPVWSVWMRHLSGPMTLPQALLTLGPMIATLLVAALIGNFIIYRIPPARRAMDAEDRDHPGTDYATAQKALGQLALYATPITLLLLFAGAWWLDP